jgi:hypothetical protein
MKRSGKLQHYIDGKVAIGFRSSVPYRTRHGFPGTKQFRAPRAAPRPAAIANWLLFMAALVF